MGRHGGQANWRAGSRVRCRSFNSGDGRCKRGQNRRARSGMGSKNRGEKEVVVGVESIYCTGGRGTDWLREEKVRI